MGPLGSRLDRLRLLAAGTASVIFALALAGLGLLLLFERHVERRMAAERGSHLTQLVSSLVRSTDGTLDIGAPPAEPRFLQPLSGLYWQITEEGANTVLRSRSLWDATLPVPPDMPAAGQVHQHTIPGPGGASLLAVERRIALPAGLGGGTIRAVVAVNRAEVHAAGLAFASMSAAARMRRDNSIRAALASASPRTPRAASSSISSSCCR